MKMLIGDDWVDKEERISVTDPYDGELIDTVPKGDRGDMDKAIREAVEGYDISRNMPVHKRITILKKTADILEKKRDKFAETIAREGSKTIEEARSEVRRAINTITISAEETRRITGKTIPFDSVPGSENRSGYYCRFPIGVIGAITPFNDPLNLVAHKVGPAIAAGNSVVLKPASATPLSALKLGKALLDAGLPKKVLNIVTGEGNEVGDALVSDDRVRMISFTGGIEAGLKITRKAGLKKIGMELGSNSPCIIMNDAELNDAVRLCVSGAFGAAGQNCIGVQRILIHEEVYDEFRDNFVRSVRELKAGDKFDEETDIGPMISEKEAVRVDEWVKEAVDKGARLLAGGEREKSIYHPTVLSEIPDGAKVDTEEIFGPVVCLYHFSKIEDAIEKANWVEYGLHAGVFTEKIETAFKVIEGLEVGGVMVNDTSDYRIDMMPFGGVKKSGLGREGIKNSIEEMTEEKVVCFNL